MKKTKAVFAAMIIVVVAAASAGLWYLNENGKLANEPESHIASDNIILQNDKAEDKDDFVQNENDENGKENVTENMTEETSDSASEDYDVDEFLSVFSKVYFAENSEAFSIDDYSDYDLIMFAYLHIKNTDKSLLGQEEKDDDIVYYTTVPYEEVNAVIEKYFGVTVDDKSVYTENDYEFFKYDDGYFYTPSADGLAYKNVCEATHITASGDVVIVEFTVYSDGVKYASGEAKIRNSADGMKLEYYKISY